MPPRIEVACSWPVRAGMANATDLTNSTLDSGVLGLSFDPNLPITSFVTYNLLNMIICAVLPIPLASSMVATYLSYLRQPSAFSFSL